MELCSMEESCTESPQQQLSQIETEIVMPLPPPPPPMTTTMFRLWWWWSSQWPQVRYQSCLVWGFREVEPWGASLLLDWKRFGLCLGLGEAEDASLKQQVNGRLINQVLETQFLDGRHVEKTPNQTSSEHWNQVFESRFISPKSSILNSIC